MVIGNFVHLEVSVYNNNHGGSGPKAWRCGRSEQRRIWRVCRREKQAERENSFIESTQTVFTFRDQFSLSLQLLDL